MHVLGLCSYPIEAAATRYRLAQYAEPFASRGIFLEVSPFLNSALFAAQYGDRSVLQKLPGIFSAVLRRFAEISKIRRYDLLFIQREAVLFGPAFFEWVFRKVGNIPVILDLDDATYLAYESPTYGKIGSYLKFFGKTDNLIKRADAVICGNRFIAEYVEKKGVKTVIVPTVVDTAKFTPVKKKNRIPVIGWIGTHSTFPLLQSIFPVLQDLARKHELVLKIVGAGRQDVKLEGVKVENTVWSLEREIADFQSLDIGLYPIKSVKNASDEWILGKSGFKAIQYLAVGIPFVMTPVGVCAEIGEENVTHFNAKTGEDWYNFLEKLLASARLRREMGEKGREYSLKHFTVAAQAEILAQTFKAVAEERL